MHFVNHTKQIHAGRNTEILVLKQLVTTVRTVTWLDPFCKLVSLRLFTVEAGVRLIVSLSLYSVTTGQFSLRLLQFSS